MHELFARKTIDSIEPINRTGLKITLLKENDVAVVMPLAGNTNHKGVMYAGSLFSLAECAPGLLFLNRFGDSDIAAVCSGLDIRFRRPALSDISLDLHIDDNTFLTVEKDLSTVGKSKIEFDAQLRDISGEAVAIVTIKYVLLKLLQENTDSTR